MTSDNNKRIAKNTMFLYFRMLLVMGVSLYTSRVVLNTLGIEDFGIYNVVGGIVTMFSFLNGAMTTGTQRFLSFELGKNDYHQLQRVFSMSITIHLYIAIIILILSETLGLWFLNTQLNIPVNRMIAANWVYQFSILSFVVSIINVPYNALIVAHEKMNIYAYVSVLEVFLKLGVVFLLLLFGYDKLTLYAVLIFCIALLLFFVFKGYTNKTFKESRYTYFIDKDLFKTLTGFAGWNLFGNIAYVSYTQGVNILLNIFFGPVVNAARGITFQINNAVMGFVTNFQMALNPQIVKSYSKGEMEQMHALIFRGAKFSFFLLFIIVSPILIETEYILKIWLGQVPKYTVLFTRLVLIIALIDSISGTLMTAAQASGKIKKYQIILGSLLLSILPISYIFYKFGFSAEYCFYINIIIIIITFGFRLVFLNKIIQLSIRFFLSKVILKIIFVLISNFVFLNFFIIENKIYNLFLLFIYNIISVFILGLNKSEKQFVFKKLNLKE